MAEVRVTAASGTSAEWANSSLVLAVGQLAWETDTQIMRVGNGIDLEPSLPIITVASGAGIPGPAGPAGATGPAGSIGPAGPAGQGVPTGGTAGQVLTKNSATNYDTGWATPTTGSGGGGDAATPYGTVWLDSYTGTDDAKLTAALAAVSADTYPRTIRLAARAHTFSTANRVAFDGLRIQGPEGYGNPERNSGAASPTLITLSTGAPWFVNPSGAQVYSCSFSNLSFRGSSTSTFLGQNGGGGWYCLGMKNIYSSGLYSLLGTRVNKLLLTAATFSGWWEINNCYDTAITIGGSDNTFWTDGMLLDSNTAFNSTPGIPHLWLSYCDKSVIGPLYITCEGPWQGIQVDGPAFNSTGSSQGGPLIFTGLKIEGRNAGAPSYGAVFRMTGGIVMLRDVWASYAMSSPTTQGHSPADAGVIHHAGGTLIVDGATYNRATGVAETVPFVYSNSTGDAIVTKVMRASNGGAWSGRPRFAKPTANAENRTNDATTTLINV